MGFDLKDGKKDIFVKYLDYQRAGIYRSVIECNTELVKVLYRKTMKSDMSDNPLWLFHGGELINLYSTQVNRVPTKDIDLKLYMTGDYSIDPKIFKRAAGKMSISLKDYDFYDTKSCLKTFIQDTRRFRGDLTKLKTPSKKSAFEIWKIGEKQKIQMCVSMVVNRKMGIYSQLNLKTGRVTDNLTMDDFSRCKTQRWMGDNCKAFIVNTPYVTQVGRCNIPYNIDDKTIYKMGSDYDEDIDGYRIDESFLEKLDEKLRVWKEDEHLTSESKKTEYLTNYLWAIRCKHHKFKLSTVVGVVLVYNESRGEWYMFQEGLLDLYNDYSAGHHPQYEKRYLGRYSDGSFPTVLRNMTIDGKHGIMKFPSMSWMVFDQLRMLYITLKDSYPDCSGEKCAWKKIGGGAAGNFEKYFKKLLGLLNSYESTILSLQNGSDLMNPTLKKCNSLNLERCGSQAFLNSLFTEFEMKRVSKKQVHRSKRAKPRNKHRNRTPRKTGGDSKSAPLSHRLMFQERNFENYM